VSFLEGASIVHGNIFHSALYSLIDDTKLRLGYSLSKLEMSHLAKTNLRLSFSWWKEKELMDVAAFAGIDINQVLGGSDDDDDLDLRVDFDLNCI